MEIHVIGGKRKREEGRAAPTSRTKPKVADMDQLDDHNVTTVITRTRGRPGNSGSKQPRMEGSVKVELDSEVEPGIAHNNQDQELLEEHSFSTQISADPDIDIGDIEVKVLQYNPEEEELIIEQEDEEGSASSNVVNEAETSFNPKVVEIHSISSNAKSSEWKVNTSECTNDGENGATGGWKNKEPRSNDTSGSDGNVNQQVKMTGSNPDGGAPLIIQNLKVAVPTELLMNKQEKQASSSLPNSMAILPRKDTSLQGKDALNGPSSPCCPAFAESSDLKMKLEAMQNQVTQLLKDSNELAWFKNKYAINSDWDSELHLAASSGTVEAVKELVRNGAYVNSRNKKLFTPLSAATMRADTAVGLWIIKYLCENGADLHAKDSDNCTFLHHVVRCMTSLTPTQFHDIATYLVSKNVAKLFNVPGWNNDGVPLQHAVYNIEVEGRTLTALQMGGVDLKVLDKETGNNLLFYALEGNRSTRLLIDLILLGLDWRHLNKDKRSLLHVASEFCNISGVKYLLTLGLDVNALDNFGDTPLHRVMLFGIGDILGTTKVLIENGASVEIKNSDGRTPIDEALCRDDMPDKDDVVRLLQSNLVNVIPNFEIGVETKLLLSPLEVTQEEDAVTNKKPNTNHFSDVKKDRALNEQVEMAGSSLYVGTSFQNPNVAVPFELLTSIKKNIGQDSILPQPQRGTGSPKENHEVNGLPHGQALTENSELNLKMKLVQAQNEMLQKQLLEKNQELVCLKNTFVKNSSWNSELHLAAHNKTEEIVKKLVEDGAYVNSRNKRSSTPIMAATLQNDIAVGLRIINYLIENGADPYAMDDENRTFLHILMSRHPSLTPTQFHDVATYLVSKNLGELLNKPGWRSGKVPLQYAVVEGNIDVEGKTLSVLHECGVEFKVLDKNGDNLLFYALEGHRSIRLMIDLILLGVGWKHLNKSKQSLLHKASEYCHVSGIKYLLTLGLDVNAVDNCGNTPLHLVSAIGKGDVPDTIKVLMENGANVKLRNSNGHTPVGVIRRDDIPR